MYKGITLHYYSFALCHLYGKRHELANQMYAVYTIYFMYYKIIKGSLEWAQNPMKCCTSEPQLAILFLHVTMINKWCGFEWQFIFRQSTLIHSKHSMPVLKWYAVYSHISKHGVAEYWLVKLVKKNVNKYKW